MTQAIQTSGGALALGSLLLTMLIALTLSPLTPTPRKVVQAAIPVVVLLMTLRLFGCV